MNFAWIITLKERVMLAHRDLICRKCISSVSILFHLLVFFCYIDFNPLLKSVNRNFFYSTCMQCHCYKQVFPVGCVQNKRIWVWSYKMNYCNKATVRRWLPHSQQQQSYFGLRSLQLRQQPVILQWRHRWFPHEMTSTDNASLPRSG